MSKQIDIFGNETEVTNPPPSGGRRYKRMQELYGVTEGKTCKTCSTYVHTPRAAGGINAAYG